MYTVSIFSPPSHRPYPQPHSPSAFPYLWEVPLSSGLSVWRVPPSSSSPPPGLSWPAPPLAESARSPRSTSLQNRVARVSLVLKQGGSRAGGDMNMMSVTKYGARRCGQAPYYTIDLTKMS